MNAIVFQSDGQQTNLFILRPCAYVHDASEEDIEYQIDNNSNEFQYGDLHNNNIYTNKNDIKS